MSDVKDKRTSLQCAARGCDGCVVCDTENHGGEEALIRYRMLESDIDRAFKLYEAKEVAKANKLKTSNITYKQN